MTKLPIASPRICTPAGMSPYLCEGDPFFYGSFMYLHERLAKRFPTVVVPGVTSLTACAASLGRPVAAGADVLKVIPATVGEARLRRELLDAESVADHQGRPSLRLPA